MAGPARRLLKPALFICDIQEKFRPAIWEFPRVISTAQKMLKASQVLRIPVYATTQNAARLGGLCSELGLPGAAPGSTSGSTSTSTSDIKDFQPSIETNQIELVVPPVDKTAFSMYVPGIAERLAARSEVIIVGIESHICVTQTALDLLAHGHKVYVLADGVSSCNKEEIPLALARLRSEGVVVTTSESVLYECMGDAGIKEFKGIAGLVKETKDSTRSNLETLCKI
ncbi:Isochorismatase hydrolase [Xylona heveae TC161]|uniref:Isochorismatase hydrolase n=1 Tax=Xylona heveae (strain CBS 132557 / TC161) TaxID=1328760 RepID=A0A165FYK3_XYLHT|nr:Isochorismatase hydrolase [Xylona heveae TC161]KZF21536.1 Isochorismatase hydrolase [Xylona heveae TC161]